MDDRPEKQTENTMLNKVHTTLCTSPGVSPTPFGVWDIPFGGFISLATVWQRCPEDTVPIAIKNA